MAPRQSRKSEPVHVARSNSEGSEVYSADEEMDPVKAAQDLIAKSRKNREYRRKEIEAEHKKEVKDIADRIDTLFDARKKKVTKSRMELFDRVVAMNKRRQAIEGQILASMKTIELHSTNISSQLSAMFSGRIEEIEETTASI